METSRAIEILKMYSTNTGVQQATCERLTNEQLKEVAEYITEPERVRSHLKTVRRLRHASNAMDINRRTNRHNRHSGMGGDSSKAKR